MVAGKAAKLQKSMAVVVQTMTDRTCMELLVMQEVERQDLAAILVAKNPQIWVILQEAVLKSYYGKRMAVR